MKKHYLVLGTLLIAAMAIFNVKSVNSEIPAPPAGNTGDAFTNETCGKSGCHATAQPSAAGDVTMKIDANIPSGSSANLNSSFHYVPNTTYYISFVPNASAATNPYYGFQMSALNDATTQAGTFTTTDNAHTKINTLSGRSYMGHKGANSFKNWIFKWTAPASGAVNFNYAYNICSASVANPTNPEGDIYEGAVTIQPQGVGINDISTKLSDLTVFPNPISNEVGVSFNLKETADVQAQLYSLNGELVSELMNENISLGICNKVFNVNNVPQGIYMVKLNVGGATIVKKIVKQ